MLSVVYVYVLSVFFYSWVDPCVCLKKKKLLQVRVLSKFLFSVCNIIFVYTLCLYVHLSESKGTHITYLFQINSEIHQSLKVYFMHSVVMVNLIWRYLYFLLSSLLMLSSIPSTILNYLNWLLLLAITDYNSQTIKTS